MSKVKTRKYTEPLIGELVALRLSEVDSLRREVRLEEQIHHPRSRERMILKTPAAGRTVPMPQVVVDALAEHLAKFPANEEGCVFTNVEGRAVPSAHLPADVELPSEAGEAPPHDEPRPAPHLRGSSRSRVKSFPRI